MEEFDDNEDYLDSHDEMTLGRRCAMKLRKYEFYNPLYYKESETGSVVKTCAEDSSNSSTSFSYYNSLAVHDDYEMSTTTNAAKPSLRSAWEYFEHKVLPRFIDWNNRYHQRNHSYEQNYTKRCFCFDARKYEKAKPSEPKTTKLFPPFASIEQLKGFGIGTYLYFLNLKYLSFMTFIAGLINIQTMRYFASTNYDPSFSHSSFQYFDFLYGSAVCTNQYWVPCPTCTSANFTESSQTDRFASTILFKNDDTTNNNITLHFGLRNDCGGRDYSIPAIISFATILFITFATAVLNYQLERSAILYDEAEQTAQDYSIIIKNPPFDAYEPEEWREFFAQFDNARVTCCSINVDNDVLLSALLERKERLRLIQTKLSNKSSSFQETNLHQVIHHLTPRRTLLSKLISLIFHPFGLFYDIQALYHRVSILEQSIKTLLEKDYHVMKVYVTFETEKDQRFVRNALSISKLSLLCKNKHNINKNHLFRGNILLDIDEAPEPETIHWEHMNNSLFSKIQSTIVVNLLSCAIIFGLFVLVSRVQRLHPQILAPLITIMNLLFPIFARSFTKYERHGTETDIQASLYFKTILFRLINTVTVLYLTNDFTQTVDMDGLIKIVSSLFVTEIVIVNGLSLLDPIGHFRRHYLGPRQKTQDQMNQCFQGSRIELAERYTISAKLLILCATYLVIFPASLFLCSIALFTHYIVDKFCLLRTWAPIERVEAATLKIHTQIFTPILLVTISFSAAYWWSGFPFDYLCDTGDTADSVYFGSYNITVADGTIEKVTINESDNNFQFCNQDMLSRIVQEPPHLRGFPPFPKFQGLQHWMTDEQEKVVIYFCWLLIAMISFSCTLFLCHIISYIASFFFSSTPIGDDQDIPFSSIPSITTYIPEISSKIFSYPLLICSIDDIDHSLISWKDPKKSYDDHSLVADAKSIMGNDSKERISLRAFDRVKHWVMNQEKKTSKIN